MYDIIIIGGGPSGLTSAIYALRNGKSVLVIEKNTFGGQITFSPKVENIPGFVEISGNEFGEKLVDQVMNLGADVECTEVKEIIDGKIKKVITEDGEFEGKTIIIATGAKHRLLGLENEENFIGNGISFCAVCDGAFYKDKTVALIGGGNSALVEGNLLAETVKKLIIIQNLEKLTAEQKLIDKINSYSNVEVITSSIVKGISGNDDGLNSVTIENTNTNKQTELTVDGMFIAIGLIPQNENFTNVIELDSRGYAIVNDDLESKTKGIFVAGDCRVKKIRQVTTACNDGAIAALSACNYIDSLN